MITGRSDGLVPRKALESGRYEQAKRFAQPRHKSLDAYSEALLAQFHTVALAGEMPRAEALAATIVARKRNPRSSDPGVAFGLADPLAHGGLGQVEVLRDLRDRAVTTLALLDDLRLELRGERTTRTPGLVRARGLHKDLLPGTKPLISGVRQNGSSPGIRHLRLWWCGVSELGACRSKVPELPSTYVVRWRDTRGRRTCSSFTVDMAWRTEVRQRGRARRRRYRDRRSLRSLVKRVKLRKGRSVALHP
jgi:hypothetical protein